MLGALASGLLLYGVSLAYGFNGSMDFAQLRAGLSGDHPAAGLVVGVVFIVAGLAFKISAVPFHMWTPDVYEGAPTPVTAFMSTAPKVAAIALLLRALEVPFGHLGQSWTQLIVLISIASMLLGFPGGDWPNLDQAADGVFVDRPHGLCVDRPGGELPGRHPGRAGLHGYLRVHVGRGVRLPHCHASPWAPVGRRSADLSGLARTDPMLALAFAIFMFSMAGIPPFSGFFGKLYVFYAAVQGGYWTLAVIGVLTSVIGAYYYLRVIKVMYFDDAEPAFDARSPSLSFVAAGRCPGDDTVLRLPRAHRQRGPRVAAAALFG